LDELLVALGDAEGEHAGALPRGVGHGRGDVEEEGLVRQVVAVAALVLLADEVFEVDVVEQALGDAEGLDLLLVVPAAARECRHIRDGRPVGQAVDVAREEADPGVKAVVAFLVGGQRAGPPGGGLEPVLHRGGRCRVSDEPLGGDARELDVFLVAPRGGARGGENDA
jgi:hypothetical protein